MFSEHSLQENILYKQLHTYGDVALFGVHVCVCVLLLCISSCNLLVSFHSLLQSPLSNTYISFHSF